MSVVTPEPLTAPLAIVPGPEWRLTCHRRTFSAVESPDDTGLLELSDAVSRRLETKQNEPARLTFTLNGRSPAAGPGGLQELTTRVLAWRDGALMFSGIVTQTEDVISEQKHTLNVTCLDDLAILNRRYLTSPNVLTYTQQDQDTIAADLVTRATTGATSGNGSRNFSPGSVLPLSVARVFPDGTTGRPLSGTRRDRSYEGQSVIGELLTNLGACVGGFDLDVAPTADALGYNTLRIFYPAQGVNRPDLLLSYGSSVRALTRTVQSSGYANYVRHLGNQPTQGAPQVYADAWNADSYGTVVGLWQSVTNSSGDVSDPATLAQQAAGDLEQAGELVPSYSLTLSPEWYSPGNPALGDTLGLMVNSGRLDVSTTVKVLELNYAVSDEGTEDIELTVGRPRVALSSMFRNQARDIAALARR